MTNYKTNSNIVDNVTNKLPNNVKNQSKRRKKMLNASQKKALRILESGKNVFLTGEAGTGKSFVLNHFISRNQHKNIIVTAPTGIAAINVHGSTLHRTFGIPIDLNELHPHKYPQKTSEAIQKADIIIIDEISMCRFDCFEYVARYIRKSEEDAQERENQNALKRKRNTTPRQLPPKQVIVVGDFFQLPPVISDKDRPVLVELWEGKGIDKIYDGFGFAFIAPSWKKFNFTTVILTEQMRQKDNSDFITNLNLIRKGDKTALEWFNFHANPIEQKGSIYLCPNNKQANEINQQASSKLKGNPQYYHAQITGSVSESDKPTSNTLELKVGMQVMSLVNDPDNRYQNGTLGIIKALNQDSVLVDFSGGNAIELTKYTWEVVEYRVEKHGNESKIKKEIVGTFCQIPLKIAYAITIHKSQGQTYDSANILPDCFSPGQLYVALSRLKSIDKLHLIKPIKEEYLSTSAEVISFYNDVTQATAQTTKDNPEDVWKQLKISPKMTKNDIEQIQKEIEDIKEKFEKVGIKLNLTDEKTFTFEYNLYQMKKSFGHNPNGAKRKIPLKPNTQESSTDKEKYYTYDEVRAMIDSSTAEQVAKNLGFSKMTLYRKLKEAKERENKLFF